MDITGNEGAQGADPADAAARVRAALGAEAEIRADAVALLTAASCAPSVDEEGVGLVLAGYLSGSPSLNEIRLGMLVGNLLGVARAQLQMLAEVHDCEVSEIIQALAIASRES